MINSSLGFTPTDLIAAASKTLIDGGYYQITRQFQDWDTPTSRLFEDEYGIVGVVVFDTCAELLRTWADSQASLVEVISRQVGEEESKSWDGYLVLLSPGLAPSETTAIEDVRYNTTRLRKFVATADDLRSSTDVERVLRPLLPLRQERVSLDHESALSLLPQLLANQNIPEGVTRVLIEAFGEHSPLMEKLHQQWGQQ